VKYSPKQLIDLLRTPLGRQQIVAGLRYRAWPAYAAAARVHRARLPATTRVVAVVGTYGKTTTSRAVRAALGLDPAGHVSGNCWDHVARRVLAARAGDRDVVVEVGISGPGQMAPYAHVVRPDVTVVTSIGSEHRRSLGTLERTRDEKAHMVRALAPRGLAVLNGDDEHVTWMRGETRARVVTFGLGAQHDVAGTDLRLEWPHGIALTITARGESARVAAPLFGEKMAYPLLAATAVALDGGRPLADVARDLARVTPASGRMQAIALPNDVWLLRDEHKSGLETFFAAVDAFAQVPARRRIAVVGDVAEPPRPQGPVYRELGARLGAGVDRVIVVGHMHKRIAGGARDAGMPREHVIDAGADLQDALAALRGMLEPGDAVLVKGRDTQHLERIWLALEGRTIGCRLVFCDVRTRCERCPMLARGWPDGRRVPA
jgi:UDP-N-acetylmuramyl pentapeptide synthase